jgi:Ca2+-binding RTX toxin-like protein
MGTITGTSGDDTLTGTINDDTIDGLGGNDTIDATQGGNDVISGGDGNDTISTGDGFNQVDGGAGDDMITGGNGFFEEFWDGAGNDVVYGGGGFDIFHGSAGNDSYDGAAPDTVDDQFDKIDYSDALAGIIVDLTAASDNVRSAGSGDAAGIGVDQVTNVEGIVGSNFDDTMTGRSSGGFLDGQAGDDTLNGGAGNDELQGWSGNDTINGGDGDDEISGDWGNDTIDAGAGDDFIDDGTGNDVVHAGAGSDEILASCGNAPEEGDLTNDDTYDGGSGAAGEIDLVSYENALAGIVVDLTLASGQVSSAGPDDAAGVGTDQLIDIEAVRGSGFDDVMTGNSGDNILDGGSGNDTITDGAGSDTIYGGFGDDIILASTGAGNDVYDGDQYDPDGGAVDFNPNFDTVSYANALAGITVDLTLAEGQVRSAGDTDAAGIGVDTLLNIERVSGTQFDDSFTGNDGDNSFHGEGGNDTLSGGAGNDTLNGGDGNDYLDGGDGIDRASYIDSANGVHVSLAISSAQVTGQGVDTLVNIETLGGSLYDDELTGNAGANKLYGLAGNDALNGGAGADTMLGGLGDDNYVVDNAGDKTTENVGEGTDTVISSISWTLSDDVENLTLGGVLANNGYGNALNNVITGNGGANLLAGGDGNDSLSGGNGSDTLDGGAGNDLIDGGAGIDTASYADAASAVTVRLAIAGAQNTLGAGVDTLTGIENLEGSGFSDHLTGDAAANKLFGLDGNDVLNGGAGTDVMSGGTGNDVYYVDSYGDKAVENLGEGTDTVFSGDNFKLGDNVEKLTLTGSADLWGYGNADNNVVTGNDGANRLYGLTGNDTLNGGNGGDWLEGGAGQDRMYGGAGADSFVFRDGDFGGATIATCDQVKDFAEGEGDKIRLNVVDANTGLSGDQAFSFIGTAAFSNTAGELRYEQISGNTYVEGDTNGDGVADFMIRVDGLHTLVSGDFGL